MFLGLIASIAIRLDVQGFKLWAPATAVAIASDGALAEGNEYGDINLYAPDHRSSILIHERGPVRSLAFSPDGKVLATGFRDDGRNVTTAIWTRAGKLVRYFNALEGTPAKPNSPMAGFSFKSTSRIVWSPDGKLIAAEHDGHLNTGVRIWDLGGVLKAELGWPGRWKELPQGERMTMAAGVAGLKFSPDGTCLLTGMDDGFVRCWRLNGRTKWQAQVSKEVVNDVDFSPDGSRAFFSTWSSAHRIGSLDSKTGKLMWQSSDKRDFSSICALSNEDLLVTSGNTLFVATKSHVREVDSTHGVITHLAYSPDRSAVLLAVKESWMYLHKPVRSK